MRQLLDCACPWRFSFAVKDASAIAALQLVGWVSMPHFSREHRFDADMQRLNETQRRQFRAALHTFIKSLSQWEADGCPWPPPFPAALRIKDIQRRSGIRELTWEAKDGRCTWRFGEQRELGKVHVVWRRIGGHEIFDDP